MPVVNPPALLTPASSLIIRFQAEPSQPNHTIVCRDDTLLNPNAMPAFNDSTVGMLTRDESIELSSLEFGIINNFGVQCRSQNAYGQSPWQRASTEAAFITPQISIGMNPDVVRSGNTTSITWEVSFDEAVDASGDPVDPDDYSLSCQIAGGVNHTFTVPPDFTGHTISDPLFSAFDTTVRCEVDGINGFISATERVEVIPVVQER